MYVYYCRTYDKAVTRSGGGERIGRPGYDCPDLGLRSASVMEIVPNKALSLSLSLSQWFRP